jgi:thiol-disulfide isomerase/thioredoxin
MNRKMKFELNEAKNYLFTLLCVCTVSVHAQIGITTIKACAEGSENRTARLYLEDAITRFQWKVDEQPIDQNGCFQLSVDLSETLKAYIKIDFYQTYIYLQPDEIYTLIFDPFDFRIDERINPFRLDQFLSYRFEEADSNELNRLIWRFENMFDQFLMSRSAEEGVTREAYNNFRNQVFETFAYSGHGYFLDFKRYALADMERIFNLTSRANLFSTYIEDKEILYNNTAFADFITEYYANYFPQQIRYNRNVFMDQINRASDLSGIMDSLGRDTTLQNEKLREFVFLLGLSDLWHNPEIRRSSILRLLMDIETTTKFNENSVLANMIVQTLLRYEPGVNKADFRFWDFLRNSRYDFSRSSNLKYILFVNSLCGSCDAEISIMRTIAERFENNVDFYVVNCDYEENRALRNRPRDLGNITYLHFNKDFETLENLGIMDYPIAILLDDENIIQSYYFPLPSRGAERTIRQVLSE